jgi:acyl carrier protein
VKVHHDASDLIGPENPAQVSFKLMGTSDRLQSPSSPAELPERSDVLGRIESILRRDLKLGSDIPIGPSTPLVGGDHDLDSLDILMLLTSVEKEFNIKIPNAEVRREVFTTVGTLAEYINERRG